MAYPRYPINLRFVEAISVLVEAEVSEKKKQWLTEQLYVIEDLFSMSENNDQIVNGLQRWKESIYQVLAMRGVYEDSKKNEN